MMGKSAILTFDLSPPCLPLTMFFKNTKTYMPVFDKLTMLNFYICVCAGGQEGGGGAGVP